MHRIEVPGAQIAWAFSDESGPPVVQSHGLTSSRSRDRSLDLDLGRGLSDTRLPRYDARGHGHSTGRPVPEDYLWPTLAEDLLAPARGVVPRRAGARRGPLHGSGHAAPRGGTGARPLQRVHPLLPPTAWATRAARAEEYRRAATFLEAHGVERVLAADAAAPRPPAAPGRPDTVPHVAADLLPAVYRGAALSDLPAPEQIAGLAQPTTVLAWIGDPGHPVSTAEALVSLMPNAAPQVASTPEEVRRWPAVLAADIARSPNPPGALTDR
ncbi:alpha/beta hydrolase [Brachybacterium sp. GPGPB12]|uniref:alpha/beta fold hydrolase n=1 Tax=Brachybacterium sp. GPGPB12 TaxID=3023517 RepID=UPI00313422D5